MQSVSVGQLALSFITVSLVSTLSYMVAVGKLEPATYTASILGVMSAWLKTDNPKETPTTPVTKDRPKL